MRLQTLSVAQFRNHDSTVLNLGGVSHLFVGPNGSGKTNILDAICVLSLTKSALGLDEEDLVQWEKQFFRVRADTLNDAGDMHCIELVSQQEPRREKAAFRNDVRIPLNQLVGEIPTVVFLPSDLDLFTGSPANRRRFLDTLLCQVSGEYLKCLSTFQKVLKQRNTLLRTISNGQASADDLQPWDDQLAEAAGTVTQLRLELIEAWNLSLLPEVQALGEKWNEVHIVYERSTNARSSSELAQEFLRQMFSSRDRDILIGTTSIGPHRDDWHLMTDGHALATAGSRGQQRTALLALLFLQAGYLELRKGERPVILLDDVYSELDTTHQERVLSAFAQHQVILTGTHVPEGLPEDLTIWEVQSGTVMKMGSVHSIAQ